MLFLYFVVLVRKKNYYALISYFGFFAILTFILSSWWCWWYGASFGVRTLIDFYGIFILGIALLLKNTSKIVFYSLIPIIGFTSYLNIVQSKQYNQYTITWDGMTKEGYWKVFLKDHRAYNGILLRRDFDLSSKTWVGDIRLKSIKQPKNKNQFYTLAVPSSLKTDTFYFAKVSSEANFNINFSTFIEIYGKNDNSKFYLNTYLAKLANLDNNTPVGNQTFEFKEGISFANTDSLLLRVEDKTNEVLLEYLKVEFYK